MAKPTPEQLEHIQQLIEALESGEYKQIKNKLHDSKGYCCLGVACEVYRKGTGNGDWVQSSHEGNGDWVQSSHDDTYAFLNEDLLLPIEVQEYFNADFSWRVGWTTMSDLNDDHGKTFPEIAAILRQTYFPESVEVTRDPK